ncbi:MAG: enoyl-CoA hydratase/isomerase family protein, partial [Dehalococcoidia bacterium]|nr:enoyl-CoA hydratase/isomerase family protein [Dehalococcoidia bacterium]
MSYTTVLVERRGDIGIVTLNRPERMNAIDNTMSAEIGEAVTELNEDATVGAIVLTGAGRAFCSGADFSRFEDAIRMSEGQAVSRPRLPMNWVELVRNGKPVVCAINGACIGAGLTRTLPCDVRIASSAAKFSMRFVKVGIVEEIASSQILPQIVGLQVAADLIMSGRTFGAEEALAMGIVLKVVEPERLLEEALALAGSYAENGTATVLEAK